MAMTNFNYDLERMKQAVESQAVERPKSINTEELLKFIYENDEFLSENVLKELRDNFT